MKRQILKDHKVIFLHIPKTAGTTLNNIIERNYPANERFSLGAHAQEDIAQFQSLGHAERAQIKVLNGHLAYGLHKYMVGPTTYFTILRDPIERMVSFYYFVRRNPEHYLYDFVHSTDQGMGVFLRQDNTYMFDNFQTRLISGVWDQYPVGECPPSILEQAKTHLNERFAVVGLTERFDETLLMLREMFDWGDIYYTRKNVSANRPLLASLDKDILAAMRAANHLDVSLYNYACELFASQVRQRGRLFPVRVKAFQVANRRAASAPDAKFDKGLFFRLRTFSIRSHIRGKVKSIHF